MKKIKYILTTIFTFLIFTNQTFAYSFDVSVTSKSVTVGNTITLTINGSDLAGKFTISSSNPNVASVSSGSVFVDNDTQRITITTKNTGTASITINPEDVTSYSGETVSGSKTITITVNPKPQNKPSSSGSSSGSSGSNTQTPKSTNSYLSSLTVEGLELNEKFDKENLEYTVNVPADTEKIKINAQLADSEAKVTGIGEVSVSEGLNTFEIVVTAQNGSKRTYILKATVEEVEPIKVVIDNETYTVVRKRKDLPPISEYFEESDITIDNEKVEGYYNDTLKYNLVGLKDQTGKITYYIYKSGKYTKYLEYTFNGTTLQVLDKEVSGAKLTSFIYDSDKIPSYQEVKLDIIKNTYALDNNDIGGNQFYLFYAINVETGKESLYQYDASEKTIQRYNTLILDQYKDRSDKYYMCLLGSLLLLGITIITFTTILICKNKKNKPKIKLSKEQFVEPKDDLPIKDEEEFSFDDLPIKKEKTPSSPKKTNKTKKNR